MSEISTTARAQDSEPEAPQAVIHDLGYQRYAGNRLAANRRWRVIMRNQVATAWKGWWRFKSPLAIALITTMIAGAVMYVSSNKLFSIIASSKGMLSFSDGIVPFSMTFFSRTAFIFSLTVSASVIASDAQSGGFTFYFSRPVRPADYVIGKFAGLFICTSLIMVAGPMFLAFERLGLADDGDAMLELLPVLPKTLAAGTLGALLYAALPLGFSALSNSRRNSVAIWAGLYLIGGNVIAAIGRQSEPALIAFDPPSAITSITFHLFDIKWRGGGQLAPLSWAIAAVVFYVVLGLGIAYWRVKNSRSTGVGGTP